MNDFKSHGPSLSDRIATLNQEIKVSSAMIAEGEVVATNGQIDVLKQQLGSLEASVLACYLMARDWKKTRNHRDHRNKL